MAFNDALSDMLARIKNAHKARKSFTSCYKSKLNLNVLTVLKDEGYIRDFQDVEIRKGISNIKIDLKYYNGTPVIKNIANCDNCTTQVDLTKYIRKDKIPCWGCNLGDVDKSDKTKHSCNLKNL